MIFYDEAMIATLTLITVMYFFLLIVLIIAYKKRSKRK